MHGCSFRTAARFGSMVVVMSRARRRCSASWVPSATEWTTSSLHWLSQNALLDRAARSFGRTMCVGCVSSAKDHGRAFVQVPSGIYARSRHIFASSDRRSARAAVHHAPTRQLTSIGVARDPGALSSRAEMPGVAENCVRCFKRGAFVPVSYFQKNQRALSRAVRAPSARSARSHEEMPAETAGERAARAASHEIV